MGKSYNRSTGYRPRKRKFHGKQSSESVLNVSASAKKLKLDNSFTETLNYDKHIHGYRIVDISEMLDGFMKYLCCKVCKSEIKFSESKVRGSASTFVINCTCSNVKSINTCPMNGKRNNIPDVNRRLIYGMRCLGQGLAGLKTFCGVMDMPPPVTRKCYETINTKILQAAQTVAVTSMLTAAEEEQTKVGSCDIVVSGDGSWKTRGYTSKIGACTVIGTETGKVIDIEVLSSYCKSCERSVPDHDCQKDHSGSAGAMEVVGMRRIFLRSEKERKGSRYLKYLGDGDTKTFSELFSLKPYGETLIEKLECIGHVQKRMGTRLRKHKEKMKGVKLPDGKTLGGKGRLTDKLIDQITVYYGNAIRSNTDSLSKMKTAIWAIYCHLSSTDKEPMHMFCPEGADSWCKHQKHIASGEATPFVHVKGVPVEVMKAVKKIFVDLSSPDLLKRCLMGKTQNPNESFNCLLWKFCPKSSGAGKRVAKAAAYEAVVIFNEGNCGRLGILKALGLNTGSFSQKCAMDIDHQRLKTAEKRAQLATLEARQLRRRVEKHVNELLHEKEGIVYKAGEF